MGSSLSTSQTIQTDNRNFAESGSALAGQGSQISYPGSVSVFGSPGSDVGDITFVTHKYADQNGGLSDQLSGIMSAIEMPAMPVPSEGQAKPNYLLYGGIAVAAFLLLKGF